MYKFRCPACRRPCKFEKKLSQVRNVPEKDRLYVWSCDGQSKTNAHPPTVWREVAESVIVDSTGRVQSKISKLTRITIEDAEMHELLDDFKHWLVEGRYKEQNPRRYKNMAERHYAKSEIASPPITD